jgi:hypothetical protein
MERLLNPLVFDGLMGAYFPDQDFPAFQVSDFPNRHIHWLVLGQVAVTQIGRSADEFAVMRPKKQIGAEISQIPGEQARDVAHMARQLFHLFAGNSGNLHIPGSGVILHDLLFWIKYIHHGYIRQGKNWLTHELTDEDGL